MCVCLSSSCKVGAADKTYTLVPYVVYILIFREVLADKFRNMDRILNDM
jgi:hypothetical protein